MFDDVVNSVLADTIFGYEEIDINKWYSHNNGICNHCGADMRCFHPSQNIYPH